MKKRIIQVLKVLLFVTVGLGIAYIFWINLNPEDKEACLNSLRGANYFWISSTLIFGTLAHISRAMRWKLIIEPFGYKPRTSNLFFAVMTMYFVNMAVTRLGEFTRCIVLQRYEKIPFEKSFGTVVAERAVDMVMLAIMISITALLQMENLELIQENFQKEWGNPATEDPGFLRKNLKWIVLATLALMAFGLFLFRKHPVISKFYQKGITLAKGFWEGLRSITKVKRPWEFIAHTLFIWVMYFLMTYLCFFALAETSTYNLIIPLTVLVFGSIAITVVPGGIGVFPVITTVILQLYGIDRGVGYALGWIIWFAQTLLVLLLGILSVILLPVFNRKSADAV